MSLATRCTACGTIFRVVQEQLKVSEGWVRCGRCNAVFQATEGLFDLEREAPPAWSADDAATRLAGGLPQSDREEHPEAPDADRPREDETAETPRRMAEASDAPTDAEATLRALSAAAAVASLEARRPAPPEPRPAVVGPRARLRPADVDADADADADADTDADADAIVAPSAWPQGTVAAEAAPSVRATERAERPAWPAVAVQTRRAGDWHGWRARAGLSAMALLLCLALAAQVARQFSDIAAARWPEARAALVPWCRWTGCSLAAPRRIDEVLVESTSLAPEPGTEALRIGIVLRNRAPHAVATPSVDLTLTDSSGNLIARRSLQPTDFRNAPDALSPRADVPLQALLLASGGHVTGYAVEIFYP